jgi:Leucine-rich repeat (LRR) protein|tara:strand:+ start:2095 stop:2451 length:357 start_codon:yes stop_codon:yes gene_type:complete
MGITSFESISKYTLRQEGDFDILKIYYKREKGSFLPRSKKFRFGRATRTVMVDSGRQQWQEVSEISPFLLRALTELNKLAHEENKVADNKESISEDLLHLERIMAEKLAEIRAKIDQL